MKGSVIFDLAMKAFGALLCLVFAGFGAGGGNLRILGRHWFCGFARFFDEEYRHLLPLVGNENC